MSVSSSLSVVVIIGLLLVGPTQTHSRGPHNISFLSKDLYPHGLAYDPTDQHFLVSSTRRSIIVSVSDAGITETLISDPDLPANSTLLGLAVDDARRRVLAAVNAPGYSALVAYQLPSRRRLFLSPLHPHTATAVAVDQSGNAYVSNSAANFIWKVTPAGDPSIFSNSTAFASEFRPRGLSGLVHHPKGYLLAVQSNSGSLFKVRDDDGSARRVPLDRNLPNADGIAVRGDGKVVVVSAERMWVLNSRDSWGEGEVVDEIPLDEERSAASVAVGREDRMYVVYSHAREGLSGLFSREAFTIEEVQSEQESRGNDDRAWVFVMIGFGLAYFLFWRFQMRSLISNMDKKHY